MCLFAYIDTCTHRDITCFTKINLCMFAKPYTHMYTCYLHRCIHANMLAYKHAASHRLHTYISPYLLECLYAYMHTCIRVCVCTYLQIYTRLHISILRAIKARFVRIHIVWCGCTYKQEVYI